MSLFDHFKPWKLVGELELVTNWTGGLFNKDREWSEEHTVAFYEKSSSIRKVKILGDKDSRVKEIVERMVYKWRDHKGQLPDGVEEIA